MLSYSKRLFKEFIKKIANTKSSATTRLAIFEQEFSFDQSKTIIEDKDNKNYQISTNIKEFSQHATFASILKNKIIIKLELEILSQFKYFQQFFKMFVFVLSIINYSIDKIFIQFLRITKSIQIFNYLIEEVANVLVLITKILIIVNTKKAKKIIKKIKNYYIRVD